MRLFRDENDYCYTLDELVEMHDVLVKEGSTDLTVFNVWLADCVGKNGSLEEITALTNELKKQVSSIYDNLCELLERDGQFYLSQVVGEALDEVKTKYNLWDD